MKLNNKGYMLAEVVVAASLIAVVLVTLFIGLNRASSSYEKRNRYHDIDAMQVSMTINDIILNNNDAKEYLSNNYVTGNYNSVISVRDIDMDYEIGFESLQNIYTNNFSYNIISYITKNNVGSINDIKSKSNVSATFKDYVDYLSTSIDFSEDYNYIIVTELRNTEDINDCYYYALKVRSDSE